MLTFFFGTVLAVLGVQTLRGVCSYRWWMRTYTQWKRVIATLTLIGMVVVDLVLIAAIYKANQ